MCAFYSVEDSITQHVRGEEQVFWSQSLKFIKTTPSHTFWFGMGLGKSPDVHLNSIGEILRKIQHTWDEVVAMDNKFTTNDWP